MRSKRQPRRSRRDCEAAGTQSPTLRRVTPRVAQNRLTVSEHSGDKGIVTGADHPVTSLFEQPGTAAHRNAEHECHGEPDLTSRRC
jgi:hypothetical protein